MKRVFLSLLLAVILVSASGCATAALHDGRAENDLQQATRVALTPATVAFDAATAPLWLPLLIYFLWAGSPVIPIRT